MRLLAKVNSKEGASSLAEFLHSNGIQAEVDVEQNRDWGDQDYGTLHYLVWIFDEDQFAKAKGLYERFLTSPPPAAPEKRVKPSAKRIKMPLQKMSAPLTLYLILVCTLLLFIGAATSPEFKEEGSSRPVEPLYTSPIKRELLYDFPKAYELMAELITKMGAKEDLKSERLVAELNKTPYWQGIYEAILTGKGLNAPTFEKIRQGEVWRIFSPILLHGDIFHLLFNMIWLYVLGIQLERRMGALRYLSFILLAAAFSNTAQYLMSGPNFLGFSGVLCAFITYVYVRQKIAPWEGYQLQRSTLLFVMAFIFGMFSLQLLAFIVQVATGEELGISIANTAHLSGAALGVLFGMTSIFNKPEEIAR